MTQTKQHQKQPEKQHQQRPPQYYRRTVWQIYKAVPPRYRILLGMGFMGFSMVGIWASDKLEDMYPPSAESRVVRVDRDATATATPVASQGDDLPKRSDS
ncbi:hypothetical protein LPJ72_000837 [Coemansia sp. Benny D160-2]|nr:hypothetical protein LPJ72_000837 [Coemansia sp. Benny D160-2]